MPSGARRSGTAQSVHNRTLPASMYRRADAPGNRCHSSRLPQLGSHTGHRPLRGEPRARERQAIERARRCRPLHRRSRREVGCGRAPGPSDSIHPRRAFRSARRSHAASARPFKPLEGFLRMGENEIAILLELDSARIVESLGCGLEKADAFLAEPNVQLESPLHSEPSAVATGRAARELALVKDQQCARRIPRRAICHAHDRPNAPAPTISTSVI